MEKGDRFKIELLNPSLSYSRTKAKGDRFLVAFEITREAWLELQEQNLAGMLLAAVCEVVEAYPTEGAAERAEKKPSETAVGPRCWEAVGLCGDKNFQKYIEVANEYQAGKWLCKMLGITSRRELDEADNADEIYKQFKIIMRGFTQSKINDIR